MKHIFARIVCLSIAVGLGQGSCPAWDYEGHRLVNQLALGALPAEFPSFVKTAEARERIAFLSGEPDRWRNSTEQALNHASNPDHYVDFEELEKYHLDAHALPRFRYDFTAQMALYRAAHPAEFPAGDAASDRDHTRQLMGFLPWAILENFDKLKSEFSYLKAYQQSGGTPEEIVNAQANIIYTMGVMGHFVGDASQPLHTTIHHHGWVGSNPQGFTTDRGFHALIDGGYMRKVGGADMEAMKKLVTPAQLITAAWPEEKSHDAFAIINDYLMAQFQQVTPLYELEKAGKLSGEGEKGLEGKAFLQGQMARGGQMLGNLWFTAWQEAPVDTYLQGQLARRQNKAGAGGPAGGK